MPVRNRDNTVEYRNNLIILILLLIRIVMTRSRVPRTSGVERDVKVACIVGYREERDETGINSVVRSQSEKSMSEMWQRIWTGRFLV